MGVHDGHRQRVKERFKETGLQGFSDINALEFLLFYAVPRRDTNELAHMLMERFGSLTAIMEADFDELLHIDGIGENTAMLLSLIPQISRRYMERKTPPGKHISCGDDAAMYFVSKFAYESNEVAYIMFLDAKHNVICTRELSRGVVNAVELKVRTVVEACLKLRAVAVIVAHNHPNSDLRASDSDEHFTSKLREALFLVDIKMLDHIIVSGNDYVSMRTMGVM